MTNFEVRILNADGRPAITSQWRHLNADAAIAAARRLAGNKHFEVWDGDHCLYTTLTAFAALGLPPDRPAA